MMSSAKSFYAALICVCLLAACTPAPDGPKVGTARLANGLEIIVIPDSRADVVTHMLWYRVGSADEPKGKSGIAHFFEHLMFRGTENIPPGEFSKTVARLGGQDNAFTSYDYTAYFQRIAKVKLAQMMAMEAERMQKLIIKDDIVAIERDVILEERSMRVDGRPASLLSEKMRHRLHKGTAYEVPVIGWRAEIEKLNAADATAFYRRYYAPDNAVLVVAGAVTLDEVLALAQTHYGALHASGRPRAPRQVATDLTVAQYEQAEVLADARVRQPSWQRLYRLPQYQPAHKRQFAAADVLAEILGGGLTARLYQELVVTQKLAVNIGAYSDSSRLDNGEFMIYAVPAPQVDFARLAAAIDDEIAKLQNAIPDADALRRAKRQLVSELVFARDSQESMANIFGSAAMIGLSPEDVLAWVDEIDAVRAEDVQRAAQNFLLPAHAVTGHLKMGDTP
jgi:zinc protease